MIQLEKEKNVVITAGASGIGRTITRGFIQQGCRVFVCDISDDFIQDFQKRISRYFHSKKLMLPIILR